MVKVQKLPKLGFIYLDYVLRFFDYSNFKGWPEKIETVTYHWKNDKTRFINEVRRKNIDVLVGNIPATAYETFKEIASALPHVRFIPSIESQFCNKSKENVTLFCEKHGIAVPKTLITYDEKEADKHFKSCHYPQIVKRSYGASNYGGYFVHKVDNYKEAKELFEEKKYKPVYTQDAIPLKDSGDIRVMLIGHKPVCAFWRYSGSGEWITNTSQGGDMSYDNVPMAALELAVKASKAAKTEYWACDIGIDKNTGKAYIIECATAFAAFPYIRDWIGQYIMWDLSGGKFRLPHVPLYSWEELGKMDSSILRTLRHLYFAEYKPSVDGTYWLTDKGGFSMELTDKSSPDDVPQTIEEPVAEDQLEQMLKVECEVKLSELPQEKLYDVKDVSLTELMTLQGMEEDVAVNIKEIIEDKKIGTFEELKDYINTSIEEVELWEKSFKK